MAKTSLNTLTGKIRRKVYYWVYDNKPLAKLFYDLKLMRPTNIEDAGVESYRQNSSWSLLPEECSCDLELIEYLQQDDTRAKSIFHFGTGNHHIVGLENEKLSHPNQILGITASQPEHKAYVELLLAHRRLGKSYKVLFADIYTLTELLLPSFDIITLFHLCEFYLPEDQPYVNHDDASLLSLMLSKLNSNGRILFYTKSAAHPKALPIIRSFEEAGQIEKIADHKNLWIYAKKPAASHEVPA